MFWQLLNHNLKYLEFWSSNYYIQNDIISRIKKISIIQNKNYM